MSAPIQVNDTILAQGNFASAAEDTTRPPDQWLSILKHSYVVYSLKLLGIAVCCYCAGRFVPVVPFEHGCAAALWPGTGIALAALILFGIRYWPGVLLAEFLAQGANGLPAALL